MNVKYVGPAKDYSGYGEACRHDIAALLNVGVGVTAKLPSYTLEISDFGDIGRLAVEQEDKLIDYDTIILHTTPNVYPKYMESGKYHIARVFWETDKLPPAFSKYVELCNEVWTGSKFNAEAIKKAGVTKPIFVIPEAIDSDFDPSIVKPYLLDRADIDKSFKFYSIFEWTERKNPSALLYAYFQEFQNGEDVSLAIKTYVDNFMPDKKKEIDSQISMIKLKLNLPKYPKLYIYKNLMDRGQVYRFHKTFDCFVSSHRGEGWGIPQMEALIMGNPIISTNLGGIHEYLTHGEDSILIDYKMVPVPGNSRNPDWYMTDQNWGEVDVDMLRKAMRACYQNRKQMREIGAKGGETVRKKFALPVVGAIMKERLEKIEIRNRNNAK